MKCFKSIVSLLIVFAIVTSFVVFPHRAHAGIFDEGGTLDNIKNWILGDYFEVIKNKNLEVEFGDFRYASTVPQAYYTTPTESVEDKYGNVTNYYRGGDTTTTKIIDSYNHTFNTIHNISNNTTNNTNNYSANIKLQDFLNSYTTNNNNYTYNTEYKSWYYDNTSNTYQFDNSQTYYNTDNSQYYISIDNSTDEYYLVDVKYSPTFVTVNYTYNTTNNNITNNYGDVTNVYYFELSDGRNSSTLSADEVAGLDLGYDVANYELVTDDTNTLSLQHFDGDYTDSSSYSRPFYSENRSSSYVDSGAFGKAVKLASGSAAGVTISGLSNYDGLTFDFRIYYDDPSSLGIYLGDTNLFQEVVTGTRVWKLRDVYSDDGTKAPGEGYSLYFDSSLVLDSNTFYDISFLKEHYAWESSTRPAYQFKEDSHILFAHSVPSSYLFAGFEGESSYVKKYGWMTVSDPSPSLHSQTAYFQYRPDVDLIEPSQWVTAWSTKGTIKHYTEYEYRWAASQSIAANFPYSTYVNQWVPMRITIDNGKLYYFVNGDLVGSGAFTMPAANKFYIKSSGTLYLDELRVTTGDMVFSDTYNPSDSPYDTNKVLALPTTLTANTIYVRHSTPVSAWRVGGVRPSNPSTGFLYIPLYDDYTGGQAKFYDGGNWVDVEAMVYDGGTSKSVKGYQFTPMGEASDVDPNLEPGRDPEDSSVTIVEQPQDVSSAEGETVTVCVVAEGDGLTFKWYYKDKGAATFLYTSTFTGDTYTTEMTGKRDGRQIYCVVTDQYGNSVQSNTVTLMMKSTPVSVQIVEQPQNVSGAEGETVTVRVVAEGDGLTYQWYFKEKDGPQFFLTNKFTGDTYEVEMTGRRDGRQIYCVVTDQYGNTIQSDTVTLAIKTSEPSEDPEDSTCSHTWEVKQIIEPVYDESGNIITEGYTIYCCSICGEEYKDTTGSGPPSSTPNEDDEEGFLGWLGDKLGDLFGALGDGIISLLEATFGKILDSLISLVEMVFEKLSKIVDLFGGFGDALSVVWSWLPEDIMTVLVLGVTIFVFLGVIKLFFK